MTLCEFSRRNLGLRVYELAANAKVDSRTVYSIERGKQPSIAVAQAVAAPLGIPWERLCETVRISESGKGSQERSASLR